MDWNDYKIKQTNIEGARASFEKDCTTLFKKIYLDINVRRVEVSQGDGGVDILIGNVGLEPITVLQCKFFLDDFGESQKNQIRNSFKRAAESQEYHLKKWILCLPRTFTLQQHKWWTDWVEKMKIQYSLASDSIQLSDGDDLIDLFKTNGLYDTVFKNETALAIKDVSEKINAILTGDSDKISFKETRKEIKKASFYLENVNNFFGDNPDTHIDRIETVKIYEWIKKDLNTDEKNVFILEGEKGLGKTVVLKDLLIKLENEQIDVLGIKADKYYASEKSELEKRIFQKPGIYIDDIAKTYKKEENYLVIIIDQLDALSQSLSSNREYMQTYNRFIADLSWHRNLRIIISTRTYDLNYDADLSIYKTGYPTLRITPIEKEKVQEVLSKYDMNNVSDQLLQLLTIPNRLDVFCKLPNKKKVNLFALTSLEDLYESLWQQLIIEKSELKLKEILYQVADKMYCIQHITIKNIFPDFAAEIKYLKSNNLLIENNNELQFFHQTFYDYTFSRQFVENKKSLLNYIDENLQSLYIRSVIKMVVDYYREYDHKEYCYIITQIIKRSKYRFHLKNLIITTLGAVSNPSSTEKKIISKLILPNLKFTEVFIGSVFSTEWLKFLLGENIPLNYLTAKKNWKDQIYDKLLARKIIKPTFAQKFNYATQQDIRLGLILRLFILNSKNGLHILIDYLDELPNFNGKENFMEHFLMNVDDWQNEKLLQLFDIYFPYIKAEEKNDNFWFYQILEKIFISFPEFVFYKIKPIIKNVFYEYSFTISFTYEQDSLLKKIYEIHPNLTFSFILSLFTEIIEENKSAQIYESYNSPLYGSDKFSDLFISDVHENSDDLIENLLLNHLKLKAATDSAFFKDFHNNYKNSDSVPHLKILIHALSEFPAAYKTEFFELIEIIHAKEGVNGLDDKLSSLIRNSIGKIFALYPVMQKKRLVEIILSVRHLGEFECHLSREGGKKYHYLRIYGQKKYLFIIALPKNEIEANSSLKKVYQELSRKFGKMTHDQLDGGGRITSGVVGPPLSAKAYLKMDLKAWKKSLLLIEDNYQHKQFLRGGKLEHSRKFQEMVTNDPERFYPFIKELFDDPLISHDYLAAGIDGLIKGNFDPLLVKQLYLKFIDFNLDKMNTMYSIWFSEYIIQNNAMDVVIAQYLSALALNHLNPDKELNPNDPLHDSLNTVRGAAIHKIISAYTHPELEEIIFSTVEKAVEDPQPSVKVAILVHIAYLNHVNLKRAFKIFLKLVNTNDFKIFKNSFRAASYYRNKFYQEMRPYFDKIIEDENLHKDGSVIIVQNWLLGYDKNKQAYNKLVTKSKTAKLEAIRVAERNIFAKVILDSKCLDIFFQFLNEEDDEFACAYSTFILRKFNISNFRELMPFMRKYSQSLLFRQDPRYFLQFLLKCTKEYPADCLELLGNMNFNIVPNIQKRGHYDTEPVQLILSVYSSLNNNFKANKSQIDKALSIFDKMLQVQHLRLSSHKAMDTLK